MSLFVDWHRNTSRRKNIHVCMISPVSNAAVEWLICKWQQCYFLAGAPIFLQFHILIHNPELISNFFPPLTYYYCSELNTTKHPWWQASKQSCHVQMDDWITSAMESCPLTADKGAGANSKHPACWKLCPISQKHSVLVLSHSCWASQLSRWGKKLLTSFASLSFPWTLHKWKTSGMHHF